MRPNVKLIISFEEFEELINFRAIGTIPNIHITGASCDNDRGMVVLSAIDMRRKPLRNIELATSVPFFEFADGKTQATAVVWAADVVQHARRRWSVYRVRDGCDLSETQFETLEQFAVARLDNGLGIDGVGIEV